jgi:hypothetical protein
MCPDVNFLTDLHWNGDQVSRSENFPPSSSNSKILGDLKCTLSAVQVSDLVAALNYLGRNKRSGKCSLLQVTAIEDHGGKYGRPRPVKLAL